MQRDSKEYMQLLLRRIKEALFEMNKKYGLAGDYINDYFNLMQNEIDKIAGNLDNLIIFSKMNIESLTRLIDILKEHITKEDNEIIKKDLNDLIIALEKELAKKIKELN